MTSLKLAADTLLWQMVWYGMVNVDLYSAIVTKVSNNPNHNTNFNRKPQFLPTSYKQSAVRNRKQTYSKWRHFKDVGDFLCLNADSGR